jgi:hypothetical protein
MDKEKFLMFCAACIHKGVEDPTVWDVDSLTDAANQFLALLYLAPDMFDGMPIVKKGLFWTRLMSRFKLMKFNREDTRKFVEMYGEFKGLLVDTLPNAGTAEVFQMWQIVGDNFIFG